MVSTETLMASVRREPDLPQPIRSDETAMMREERRLTAYLPLVIGVTISAFLALLWRVL